MHQHLRNDLREKYPDAGYILKWSFFMLLMHEMKPGLESNITPTCLTACDGLGSYSFSILKNTYPNLQRSFDQ